MLAQIYSVRLLSPCHLHGCAKNRPKNSRPKFGNEQSPKKRLKFLGDCSFGFWAIVSFIFWAIVHNECSPKFERMNNRPKIFFGRLFISYKLRFTVQLKRFPNNDFETFLNYYEKFWMKKDGPRNFSVFKKVTRTTSDIEAYNGVLGLMIPRNGNFHKFVKVLQDEEFIKSRNFKMLIESGSAVGAEKRKFSAIERNRRILESSEKLENGNITTMRFLDRMVYSKNNICTDMEPYEDIFEDFPEDDVDEEEDIEEAQFQNCEHDPNVCIICVDIRPNIVLLPCKHLYICSACNLKLEALSIAEDNNTYSCPVCRHEVADSMQIFTLS